jgi:sulfite exporter TauE/SafE
MSAAAGLVAFGAGTLAGLASSAHCAGMCGPLAAHACRSRGAGTTLRRSVAYHAGRLMAYALLGALAGGIGHGLVLALPERLVQAVFSWSLAIALGFAAMRAFRASRDVVSRESHVPSPIELGRAPRKPSFAERILARTLDAPFLLGTITAILPCGALATGLLVAAGSGTSLSGAGTMIGFALASGPALVLAAFAVDRLVREAGPGGLRLAALALALGAVVLAVRPVAALRSPEQGSCHTPAQAMNAAQTSRITAQGR